MTLRACDLPADAFLQRYVQNGSYTDCFVTELPGQISLSRYVEAFYTTWLFKTERTVLSLAGHHSTDAAATEVARGTSIHFAAWRVEDREEDQLLMCDVTGRTRSWFSTSTISEGGSLRTLLYFGSSVIAVESGQGGRTSVGPVLKALTGFHKLYSRALLAGTRRKLASRTSTVQA